MGYEAEAGHQSPGGEDGNLRDKAQVSTRLYPVQLKEPEDLQPHHSNSKVEVARFLVVEALQDTRGIDWLREKKAVK
jgi:hypothetical protein